MHDQRLKDIVPFVTSVEKGSFTAAAEHLHVTGSAVSKSISRLEARLGSRLLERTTRHLELTDAGHAYYQTCMRILEELSEAESVLAAQRTIPLSDQLVWVLQGRHGLLLTKEDGTMMTMTAFDRKYESYITFLERKLNGCPKRWYGKTKEHKELLAAGKELPPWQEISIRCHDFRKDFCTRSAECGVSQKALQTWMGHAGPEMIARVYTDLSDEQAGKDAEKLMHMDTDNNDCAQKACA